MDRGVLNRVFSPELIRPSQVMQEKNIQSLWGKWLKENEQDNSYAYELKICKTKAIPLNSVKEHQVAGLLQAKKGMYYRIYDQPWIAGAGFQPTKPFDCLWIKAIKAYVCICWYIPRKPKELVMIEIEDWIKLCKTHPRKSIRKDDVIGISSIISL